VIMNVTVEPLMSVGAIAVAWCIVVSMAIKDPFVWVMGPQRLVTSCNQHYRNVLTYDGCCGVVALHRTGRGCFHITSAVGACLLLSILYHSLLPSSICYCI